MTVGSNVNPNFPIPGVDQSSRGFRDNFSTIKTEIEQLQGKNIQLTGSLISDPIQIGNGPGDIVIPVEVNLVNIEATGLNHSVQYNLNGSFAGGNFFYNNGLVGIGTSLPQETLDVIGNARINSSTGTTFIQLGNNFNVNVSTATTTLSTYGSNVFVINSSNQRVGIGTAPQATLDVWSTSNDVAIIRANTNNADNTIRYTTSQPNATIGIAFEQINSDLVGGIRLDQSGSLSLHVGESNHANLSNASRVINILANNNVGIGSMVPKNQLDVQGNVYVSKNMEVDGVISINSIPAGYLGLPQVILTGSTSMQMSDQGKHYYSQLSSNATLTIPSHSVAPYPIGTKIMIINGGTGTITVGTGDGINLFMAGSSVNGPRNLSSYGVATIICVAESFWFIYGTGIS